MTKDGVKPVALKFLFDPDNLSFKVIPCFMYR